MLKRDDAVGVDNGEQGLLAIKFDAREELHAVFASYEFEAVASLVVLASLIMKLGALGHVVRDGERRYERLQEAKRGRQQPRLGGDHVQYGNGETND